MLLRVGLQNYIVVEIEKIRKFPRKNKKSKIL